MTAPETPVANHREFMLFLMVGGFAAGVNVVSRYLFNEIMSFELAVLPAYLAGMATAYVLSKRFVFAASGRKAHDEFIRFTLVNIFAALQVWLISVGLARLLFPAIGWNWHSEDVAHMIGVAAPVITSYFGHRYFSFAKAKENVPE